MAFYRSSYVPAFTSNDAYGSFYDASKVSLITVPERLKNYDLDVRKAHTPTTAQEYGDFLRRDQPYRMPAGFSRLREQQAELQQQARYPQPAPADEAYSQPPPPPPPLPPHHLPPLQYPSSHQLDEASPPATPDQPPSGRQAKELRPDSVRGPPPPASLERYRGGAGVAPAESSPKAELQRPALQQEQPPPSSPYQYRISRSRSPPPPPDLGVYKSHPDVYTGRGLVARREQVLSSQPQPPPPPQQPVEPQLPPIKLGHREVHLPSIEAVEVRLRDNSRVMLDVHDFYRRYLRE